MHLRLLPLAIFVSAMLACSDPGATSTTSVTEVNDSGLSLSILSSRAEHITGGTALIALQAGESGIMPSSVQFRANGQLLEVLRTNATGDQSHWLVGGIPLGQHTIEVLADDGEQLASVAIQSHPITGPIFSGPQQYPFVCSSVLEWGVQPLVDHQEEWGFPVLDASDNVIGYSKDCSIEPMIEYQYLNTDGQYVAMPEDGTRPADMTTTTLSDGRVVDFVIRWERGTINRFLYSYAVLADASDRSQNPLDPGTVNWNGRLLYHFEGGVGVGHFQGRLNAGRARLQEALAQGYAVAYSSGNRTGEHYNLQVGGETALMVKEHFIKRFGEPLYTVAIGGSGGAIQQYVYQQNHPGLIDAGVPQYSYPDMVTQTIHVGDCELLEHYMDVTDRNNPKWQVTRNRSLLIGFNSTDAVPDPLADIKRQLGYASAPGANECIPAWRGLTPLSMNPHYGQVREQDKMHPPGIMDTVQWTHYDDLKNIYGLDANGAARVPWDNVGVQYGLKALTEGAITPDEFLDLNTKIGGWKHPSEMVQEGFPFLGEPTADNFDPWSRRNMNLSDGTSPAPRTQGDLQAIRALYESGMVFDGQLNIPIVDWRHYLEDELDMHNSHQSFSARQRISNRMGNADNQLIWFTDARPARSYDQTMQALDVLHDWVMNIKTNPDLGVAGNRPATAVDACFATDGSLIAQGNDVWNGVLDDNSPGTCTQAFPLYATSRIVAGGPIEGSVFKCALKPLDTALGDGTYGNWVPDSQQIAQLRSVFPEGVCDYSQPDQGR
ncbi:hypothetical protein E3V39_09610 [Gammaproteobacteria bacterium LSUCC0112]|nr:hypothetical protein E3V39_09610 [Gammaproteobacteria bacterium LSUCC0112]